MVNKPSLKLKILRLLIQNNQLSQTEVMNLLGRNDHGNISQVCNSLDRAGFIEICDKKFNRGRPEIFYRIINDGVRYLIENSQTPTEFWTSLVLSVYYQKNPISWHDILELFDLYLKRYLKHYLKYGYYSLQLDEFNRTCNTWFEKAILHATKIPPAQKVLEVLATNPDLTLHQISRAAKEKVSTVQSIIKMYTSIPHKPVWEDVDGHHDSPFYPTGWRLQIHNAIAQSPTKGTLRLTIFGILMVLYIILKNHEGKLPHGLMKKSVSQEYFNEIAHNYKSKIPLLFEKWYLLTSCLKEYSYLNFKIILDRSFREKTFHESVTDGGNKELYLGMRESILASQRQLSDLQTAGMNVIYNFHHTVENNTTVEDVSKKIQSCFHLFQFITTIVKPTEYDPQSFISMYGNENYLGTKLAQEIGSQYDIRHLEKSLSFEISLTYYLSLRTSLWSYDIFTKIVNSDKEIREFINEHLTRIQNHYLEVQRTIRKLY